MCNGHSLNEGRNLNKRIVNVGPCEDCKNPAVVSFLKKKYQDMHQLDTGACQCNEIPQIVHLPKKTAKGSFSPFRREAPENLFVPLRRETPEMPFVPLTEGVAEGRGRLFSLKSRNLYNPRLQPVANTLRKRMTKAEACLWKYVLRAGQMKGYVFNRQRPVLRYIADFMCKPLGLIIEVDGQIHNDAKVHKHDAFRQRELESCGFTLLRFANDEVLHGVNAVKNSIALKIHEIESCNSPRHTF